MTSSPSDVMRSLAPNQGRLVPAGTTEHVMGTVFAPKPVYDPVKWAHDHGIFLWSKQIELLNNIVENKFSATRACHSVGKSFAMAIAILAWVDTYKHEAFVVFTAPTYPQVDAILGRELRDLITRLNLRDIEVLASNEVKYRGIMRGYGRKPADHNPAGLSGIHAKYPFVVIDEGGAVPTTIFTGANTIAVNPNARVSTIGNPDNPFTHFKKIQQPGSKWKTLRIDAHSSPHFTGEKVPQELLDQLIDQETVQEWKDEWGENSPLYTSKVKAEFPDQVENAIITFEDINKALHDEPLVGIAACLTLDVASSGSDEAVAYQINRDGNCDVAFSEKRSDLMKLADRAHEWWLENQHAFVVVDANGSGEGVYSRLKQLGVRVKPFWGQQAPRNKKLYINARAEAAFDLGRALRKNKIRIQLHDDILQGELPVLVSQMGEKNRFKLISKEELEEQGIKSPNRADALMMGVWHLGWGKITSNQTGFASKGVPMAATGGYAA